MLKTHPARCSRFLSVLALLCAVSLGGCSLLSMGQRGEPTPSATAQAGPGNATEPATQDPDEQTQQSDNTTGPSWGLATLQAQADAPLTEVLTLERAWYLALQNDPDYQAALSGRAAAQTEIRIGRAALLPQVQAGYSKNKITGLQRNFLTTGVRESDLDYDSTSAYVQLQQPIFNKQRYAQYQGGIARAELGEAEFAVQEYETAMRLTTSVLDAVAAQGRYKLALELAKSLEEQAVTQDALFERNEASRVDAQETRARLAVAQAEVIAAEDALQVARRQLQALIGRAPPALVDVDPLVPSRLAMQDSLIQWLERAQAHGAMIRRAQAQVGVAETEESRTRGRYWPTADLVVAWADADSENLDSLSQRSNTFQVGVQMAIPIFTGGYNTADHARTRHERRQAEHELVQSREVIAAEVTRQYTAAQSGADRIAALMSSVVSGEQSLEAARQGYEYGVNNNLDVLRRQDSLFQARYQLLEARVAWLEARVALAAAAGEPTETVFASLDETLHP